MLNIEFIQTMLLIREIRKPEAGANVHFVNSDVKAETKGLGTNVEIEETALHVVEDVSIQIPDSSIIISY